MNAIADTQGRTFLLLSPCHNSGSAVVTHICCACIRFLDPVSFDSTKTLGIIVFEVSSLENSVLSNVLCLNSVPLSI